MKRVIFVFAVFSISLILPGLLPLQAKPAVFNTRLQHEVNTQLGTRNRQLTSTDAYGTPFIIKLARDGEVQKIVTATQGARDGDFLNVQDSNGNNLFHVAKNADTVQVLASLIRKFYGTKAPQYIFTMINSRNKLGETPLHAQINAGHADTFSLLYPYSTLKQKNDTANHQLSRMQGMDERIVAQNRAIYCNQVRAQATANELTLSQAAQIQAQNHPQMIPLAQAIKRIMPCLDQN